MERNIVERVTELWKIRHTHPDGLATDDDLQVIREIIERSDTLPVTAAYIHLTRNATQTIAVNGEEVSWDTLHPFITPVGFTEGSSDLPLTEVQAPYEAYYGVKFESRWDTYQSGGTVEVRRERNGNTARMWPTDDDPDLWTATDGQKFSGIAVIPCKRGDKISVFLDHDDVSTQDLAKAQLIVWKVETSGLKQLYKPLILSAGPLAYYRLDETSGTNADDIAGHASGPFDGTYENTPTLDVTGLIKDGSGNRAVDFERGNSERVDIGDQAAMDFNGSAAFSVEAWVKVESASGSYQRIVAKLFATSTTDNDGWVLQTVDSGGNEVFSFERWNGTTANVKARETAALTTGQTYYLAGTFDGTTTRLYIDGVEAASDATSVSVPQHNAPVHIACSEDSVGANDGHFDGVIDEVAIYDRALSANEILEHYNVGRGVS